MIISKDTSPKRNIYYVGGKVIEAVLGNSSRKMDFLYTFKQISDKEKISMNLFTLTIDWLYVIGAVKLEKGVIELCL